MMYKVFEAGSWPSMDEPPLEVLKISSRGLVGEDRREFLEKRAGAHVFADLIDRVKLADGDIPIHLIAVGATEISGCNRNGDGFSKAACQKYHDTFVKHARLYKSHQNKDPQKSYGRVKLSAYNEPMGRIELLVFGNGSKAAAERNGGLVLPDEVRQKLASGDDQGVSMACLTDPDYPIQTRDRGYVPIKDLRVGDQVWTHQGRWRRVTQTHCRNYTGEVFKFFLNGLPFPLELTAEHPMWAKVFAGSRECSAINDKARRFFKDPEAFAARPVQWTEARELGIGDRLFYRPGHKYPGYGAIGCTDLAALMGYYLAEGSFGYNGEKASSTFFTVGAADSAVRRIPEIIGRLWPDVTVTIVPHRLSAACVNISVFNTEFSEFLFSQIGRGCRKKLIPPEIFNASDEVKLSFLGTWLDGDGWLDNKGAHWSTAGVNLVLQGRDLLASIGIPASIYRIDHQACATSGYPGSGVEHTLNVSHLDAWQLATHSDKAGAYRAPETQRSKPSCMRICPDGAYALRIKNIDCRFVSDVPVYNLEVEEDESYSAAGLISHNCRVEFDRCTTCNNKAANRREYCTADTCINPKTGKRMFGCRDGLTKVADDGTMQYVDNPEPEFFDISMVHRPADRTAYGWGASYMQKAASAVIGGAELAEQWGMLPGVSPDAAGVKRAAQEGMIRRLAQLETAFSGVKQAAAAFSIETNPLDITLLAKIGSRQSAEALGALAQQGVLLSPRDFLRWISGADGEKLAFLQAEVASRLPGVFTRILADTYLDWPPGNPYFPGEVVPSRACRNWAEKAAADYSLDPRHVQRRLHLAAIRRTPPKSAAAPAVKTAADSPAEGLARQYALYQVAALLSMPHSANLTAELAIIQNYSC